MKTQFNLDITTPCSENFNTFKPTPDGGFCDSCEKEVVDFTTMNPDEIITYFKNKNNANTCGRFHSSQLKTYDDKPLQTSKFNLIGSIGLACLSLFSFGTLHAQDSNKSTKESENSAKINIQDHKKELQVIGNVVDNSGQPLPGVNVILEGTATGVATDLDGDFEFPKKLKVGDVLIFSYLGMDTQKIVITNPDSSSKIELKVEIGSELSEVVILGKVAVKTVYSSKKNNK